MNFIENMKETLNEEMNETYTENGALMYRTSGKALLDLNFAVSSMRNMTEPEIIKKFMAAYGEDKMLALKWLFFARDARGGLGERRLFRVCFKHLVTIDKEVVIKLVPLIQEYGRWDDLLCLVDTDLADIVYKTIKNQLYLDYKNSLDKKPVSLLAKWLPSENTSSQKTRKMARQIIVGLETTPKYYRTLLAHLRKYIKIVETLMSENQWGEIEYPTVPSRANLIYKNAFLKHDEERRKEFLSSLDKGETTINAGVLYPHDIVHRYIEYHGWKEEVRKEVDSTLENLWKSLPDYVEGESNTICVADGSGSMTSKVGRTNISALSVANALAIYFAERCKGDFKDKYITFSSRPELVDLGCGENLRERIAIALQNNEVADTNIQKTFELILTTAVKNNLPQNEMPKNILILSDMEFNQGTSGTGKKLFKEIEDEYKAAGYKLPRLIFWNIDSGNLGVPVRENELGVALVSGFSPTIIKMVLSEKTDPYECLLEQLNSERYQKIQQVLHV